MEGFELVTSLSILKSISFAVQVERTTDLQRLDSSIIPIVSCWPYPCHPDSKSRQIRCHGSISKSVRLSHICICISKCVCVVYVI